MKKPWSQDQDFRGTRMIFQVSFYELAPLISLGRLAAQRPRKGALLRIEFGDGAVGYSDCHPWLELGDLSLSDQLDFLKNGNLTNLTYQSLALARLDAEARAKKQSLWEGIKIPLSHALVTDLSRITEFDLDGFAREGFKRLKIKIGQDFLNEAQILLKLSPQLHRHSLKIRLDFNCGLNSEQVYRFLDALGPAIRDLDFIEDPTIYDPVLWTKIQKDWKVRLALDQMSDENQIKLVEGSFSILILKPAIQKPEIAIQIARKFKATLVVTSYLDHPVGQLGAAWIAADLSRSSGMAMETCGLLSHQAYQPNPFSTQMGSKGARLLPPEGTGVGMDAQLEKLNWQECARWRPQ